MEHFIEEILVEYVDFIENYKKLVNIQLGSEENLFRGSGKIGNYKFHYHGAGCRLEKADVVCEFDFLPENGYPIKFSNWKIFEFINTHPKWKKLNYTQEDIHDGLLKLVEKKKLFFLEIEGVEFPIFQIKNIKHFQG